MVRYGSVYNGRTWFRLQWLDLVQSIMVRCGSVYSGKTCFSYAQTCFSLLYVVSSCWLDYFSPQLLMLLHLGNTQKGERFRYVRVFISGEHTTGEKIPLQTCNRGKDSTTNVLLYLGNTPQGKRFRYKRVVTSGEHTTGEKIPLQTCFYIWGTHHRGKDSVTNV